MLWPTEAGHVIATKECHTLDNHVTLSDKQCIVCWPVYYHMGALMFTGSVGNTSMPAMSNLSMILMNK